MVCILLSDSWFQIALKNKFEHPFPVDKGLDGRNLLKNVLILHPHLSLRRPESMSLGRVKGITEEKVTLFFYILR
jgi:hypothetical protein